MEFREIDEWLCKNRFIIYYLKTKCFIFSKNAKKKEISVKVLLLSRVKHKIPRCGIRRQVELIGTSKMS